MGEEGETMVIVEEKSVGVYVKELEEEEGEEGEEERMGMGMGIGSTPKNSKKVHGISLFVVLLLRE